MYMKIIKKTDSELHLKGGNLVPIFLGICFILIGVGVFFIKNDLVSNNILAPYVISFIFVIIGLLSIFLVPAKSIVINKIIGEITYQQKSLIRSWSNVFSIANVSNIEVRRALEVRHVPSQNKKLNIQQKVLMISSYLVFKDGSELLLEERESKDSSAITIAQGLERDNFIAKEVATFLGVECKVIIPQGLERDFGTALRNMI